MNLNRRSAVAAGLALPLVAACGTDEVASDPATSPTPNTPAPAGPGNSGRPQAPALTSTSEIKVGGGAIFPNEKVVVTQPVEGEFKAFDAVCSHQNCLVSRIEDEQIVCTCHFSKFSITDGSVESGPARAPLPEFPITVTNGEIFLS